MSLKRECDVCGQQQDEGATTKMVSICLPAIPDAFLVRGRQLDACYRCARAIHKAAERRPMTTDDAPSFVQTRAQQ